MVASRKKTLLTNEVIASLLILAVINALLSVLFGSITIFIAGLVLSTYALCLSKKYRLNLSYQIVVTVFVNAVFVVLVYYGNLEEYGTPYFLGNSDDYLVEYYAKMLSSRGLLSINSYDRILRSEFNHSVGNGFIIILVYYNKVFGAILPYNTIAYRLINVYLLICTSLKCVKACCIKRVECCDSDIRSAYCSIALFPNLIYIASHVFRDTLCGFLFSVVILETIQKSKLRYIKIFVASIGIYFLRPELLIVAIGSFVWMVYSSIDKGLKKKVTAVLAIGSLALCFFYLNVPQLVADKINSYSMNYLISGSGYGSQVFKISLFPFGIFVRIVYGLLTPLPHLIIPQSMKILDCINAVRALGTCWFVFQIPYWLKSIYKRNALSMLSLAFIIIICITTFTFRHFSLFYPFALAAGIFEKNDTIITKRKLMLLISSMVLMAYFIAYLLLYAI